MNAAKKTCQNIRAIILRFQQNPNRPTSATKKNAVSTISHTRLSNGSTNETMSNARITQK